MAAELEGVTLNEALQNVAERSFYESCIVSRNGDGTYDVTDDHPYVDGFDWTYEGGVAWLDRVADCTRLMDPCGSFATSDHIRYHFGSWVDGLESGHLDEVAFSYEVVYDEDHVPSECDEREPGEDYCQCDRLAGWVLCIPYAMGGE